jgi:putative hemolysin
MDIPGLSYIMDQATSQPQAISHPDVTPEIIALILTLAICAVASAAETALLSVSRLRVKSLAEEGDRRAQQIEALKENPSNFLTTILIVNNVAIVLASALATGIAIEFFPQWGEVIATLVISFVTLVFCEVTPKSAAVANADSWSRAIVPIVTMASTLLRPITFTLNAFTSGILRVLGIPQRHTGPSFTEEELMHMVNVGEEEGVLEEDERSMITNIFELSETTVREVMVPRIDMVTLESDATIGQAVDLITQAGLSRIPVYEQSIDNIIGVLYAKDLLGVMRTQSSDSSVKSLIRQAYFVPESKKLDDLLHEMRSRHVHIALVIDEYGAIAGLVTIEDLVEEIVGEIQDEYDTESPSIQDISPNEWIVDARVHIEDFSEHVDEEWEATEDYDSVGGFVLAKLDKIPSVGDMVKVDGLTLTVLATRGRRIMKVKAEREPSPLPEVQNSERSPTQQREFLRQSGPLMHF